MTTTTKTTPSPDAEDLANLGQAVHRLGMQVVVLSMELEQRDARIAALTQQLENLEASMEKDDG